MLVSNVGKVGGVFTGRLSTEISSMVHTAGLETSTFLIQSKFLRNITSQEASRVDFMTVLWAQDCLRLVNPPKYLKL